MQSFSSMLVDRISCNTIKSIAIGKFDGIHLGHKKLLDLLGENGAVLMIDSFKRVAGYGGGFLTSLHDRISCLKCIAVLDLDEIAHLSGDEFIAGVVSALPHLQRIIVGYDFRFGRNRSYGAQDLHSLCGQEIVIVPKVCYGEVPLHASVIKDFIRHGDIGIANAMLGRHYSISGEMVCGQGIGHKELVPTINMRVHGYVLPAHGVYATRVNGRNAVSFFGNRISTDGQYAIESHILDNDVSGLEREITIELHKKIRENRHFSSLVALKKQIQCDIKQARDILEQRL